MKADGERFRSVRARTLRQEVADALREAILSGRLEPGQRLVEADLARELGVSRVPVREAIGQLEQQGLVTAVPNQGARVTQPSQAESAQALALRVHLETLAARLAAVRHDSQCLDEMAELVHQMATLPTAPGVDVVQLSHRVLALDWKFHTRLVEAAGSAVLSQAWSTVGPFLMVTVYLGRVQRGDIWPHSSDLAREVQEGADRHRRLLDAIRSGDMGRAEAAIQTHNVDSFRKAGVDAGVLAALNWPTDGSGGTGAELAAPLPVAIKR